MRSRVKISLFIVLFLLLGTLATSATADPPDPTNEASTTKPELDISLKEPQEGIQNVGSSTLQSVTPTELPIGSAFDLCFGFFVQSPDYEYGDYVTVDMPDNWVVNSFAPDSVPPANGCTGVLPPAAGVGPGNIAFWQSNGTLPTGCGAWAGGSEGTLFNFCVNVTIPDESGAPWMLPWNYFGDGYGGEPHFSIGTYGPINQQPPLLLMPEVFQAEGCPNEEKTYEFTAYNNTNAEEMIVDLDYAISSGFGSCSGPASVTVPGYGNAPVVVTYEAKNEVGTSFACDITATDSAVPANTDTSQIIMDLLACYWDPAGWQLEPITDATPNFWAAGLVGTNPGAVGPVGYVIGGLGVDFTTNPNLQMYDPTAGVWTQLADLPNPRFSPAVAWIGDLIYAAGGYDANFASTGDLQVYDPETNLWDNTTLPDMPNTRGGGAGGVGTCSSGVGECLFHVGGGLGSSFSTTTLETWEFNPSSVAWTQLDNKPAGSSPDGFILGAGIGCGGKIYVGGDYRGYHDFFGLDPTAPTGSQWSVVASIPAAAGAMTPALVCDEGEQTIYLIGGSPNGGWSGFNDTVYVYDILTDTWEGPLSQTLNVAQLGSVGWFMQDKLWSVGGTIGSGAISPMPFESLERITCVIENKLFLPLIVR